MTFHEHAIQLEHLAWAHVPEGIILLYGGL